MLDRAGEGVLEHLERRLLTRVVDGRGIELGQLEACQVELPRPGPLVTADRRELGIDLGQPRPGRTQWYEVDRAEPVEGTPLARRREQLLVGVLAVEIDEIGRRGGERVDGDRAPVDVRGNGRRRG